MTYQSTRLVASLALGAAVVAAIAVPFSTVLAAPATAPAASPGSDALSSKGLSKAGILYTLKGEQPLLEGVRELAKLKAKMDADNRKRDAIEREINKAKNAFAQWEQERRVELEKLAKVKDAFQNNQIVAKIESLQDKMTQAMKYKEEQETLLRKVGDDSRAKYISLVVELAAGAEKTSTEYQTLAKDKEVTDAVTVAKGKLGPSPEFIQQFAYIKRLRAPIFAENVKVYYEGKVPLVEVTLNGSTIKKMVLDTGASYVCIPASLAKTMELVPAANDPEATMQLADGKLVKCRLTKLKSVRVGQFTIENVDCAVLPPDLVAAEPLLGGSFLNNFTFKIDTGKEELYLAKIGGNDPAKDPKKPAPK